MRKAFLSILAMLNILVADAQQTKPIDLYPNGVPNSKPAPNVYREKTDEHGWISLVTNPTLTPYFPEKGKANGAAVIVCPGGSYMILAAVHEGDEVCKRFAEMGVTAFLLKYRLPSDHIMQDKSIGPLQDAQRAIQLVRQNAAQWNIDPNRVGIIGFSAGGHLASTAITHFNKAVIDNKDNINLRPDFGVLIYPVIDFGEYRHDNSRTALVGKDPSPEVIDLYSNQKQVTPQTPPTFLVHAEDDDGVKVQNSLVFYDALLKNGVKAEMHIYQAGGHGFGLHNTKEPEDWFAMLAAWLKANGFVN